MLTILLNWYHAAPKRADSVENLLGRKSSTMFLVDKPTALPEKEVESLIQNPNWLKPVKKLVASFASTMLKTNSKDD